MKKQPRDYQINAATSLWNQVHDKPKEDPLVVMPTGTGKSITMAMFISGILGVYPTTRIMSAVHVKELVKNNHDALIEMMPTAPAGIYAADLKRKEVRQVTFVGIGSVYRKPEVFGRIDFLIVDEAHRISDKESSNYQKLIRGLRASNPNLIVIGFTATDYRMGSGKLTESGIFDHVCYDLSSGEAFLWMLQQGYLIKPVPKATSATVDAEQISIRMGEFDATESAAAFDEVLEPAVDEIILRGQDRHAWLIYAQSIEHAERIAEMLTHKGYPVEAVHSKMDGGRDDVLARFRRGELRGIVNKDILTTGYDDPRVDLIAVLRLTNSPGLWVQIIGRGTRPYWAEGSYHGWMGHNGGPPLDDPRYRYDITTREGRLASIAASTKHDCMVLDFAGNTTRLGPINYPNIPRKRKGQGGDPPVRQCPKCGSYVHISLKVCDGTFDDGTECDYVFPEVPKLRSQAADTDLVIDLSRPPEKEHQIFGVGQMIASRHKGKGGKPDSVKVDYFSGIRRFSVWLFPEYAEGSVPHNKTKTWWRMHHQKGAPDELPSDVADMLGAINLLRKPKFIKVWINTKHPTIEDYDFRGTRFELPPELGGPPLQEPPEEADEKIRAMQAQALEQAQAKRMEQIRSEMYDDDDIPF